MIVGITGRHVFTSEDRNGIRDVCELLANPAKGDAMSRVSSQLLDELFDSYDIESLWLPHQRVIATMFQTGKSLDDVNDMLVKLAEIVDDPEYGTTKYANIFEPA